MSVINTNVMSLNAQRNLTANSADLGTTIQRLSSGLRINSAKDDAAGLAISERFTTQIRGMDQAARNANDGISLAQTAEGALGEIGNNLQRIRELAVQSRNATNSADDRAALQKEVDQLKAEIDRVADTTNFNGTKLLDGSFTAQSFQVGANQGETIDIAAIADANIESLGTYQSVEVVGAAPTDFVAGTNDIAAGDLTINGVDVGAITAAGSATAQGSAVAAAINAVTAETGVTATADSTTGAVTLSNIDGSDITVALGTSATTGNTGLTADTFTKDTNGVDNTGFANLDISTAAGADKAMLAMDAALKSVNDARADLGAVQNRFSSVVTNLQTGSENLSAARSRIMDADYAKETANLSRTQILQQAGTAMLAQANQSSQSVLSLLR
ncbi:flagellin [Lysobacter arseniciresistens ZS79]|uniref:Flagellin n=1 Tax=Lysobacter arseniciresistens ZS79 TaxID=913325 RepID=A0A0A0F4G2_9GAMM|nr:flagellin [Lysobacter arseniciresistens]KGM57365.1 flagellin [Lysobacter arseniciresistens ZS79]